MSFKAKNLSYESNEPAFLRKLRSEYGRGIDPARHQHPLARPRKQNTTDGADDEPTYVHEDTLDTISKDEYTALLTQNKGKVDGDPTSSLADGENHPNDGVSENTGQQPHEMKPTVQLQANIGSTSKKRLVKAVGDHLEAQELVSNADGPLPEKATRNRTKRKKIKLSFDKEAKT